MDSNSVKPCLKLKQVWCAVAGQGGWRHFLSRKIFGALKKKKKTSIFLSFNETKVKSHHVKYFHIFPCPRVDFSDPSQTDQLATTTMTLVCHLLISRSTELQNKRDRYILDKFPPKKPTFSSWTCCRVQMNSEIVMDVTF